MSVGALGSIKAGTGLGSGIDIEGIVSSLVEVEGKNKLDRIEKDETKTLAKISSFGNLKSALSTFKDSVGTLQDSTKFKVKSTSVTNDATVSADTNYFTASANSEAVPGSYSIEVRQLAQAHKLVTDEFATESYVLGTGTLSITVGEGQDNSQTYTYTVDSGNQTLAGVRDIINDKNATTGVSATIITSDNGARLAISSDNEGLAYTLGISVDDDDEDDANDSGLSQLATANMNEFTAAQNAIIRIDGQSSDVTLNSNKAVDVIEGVTLNLAKAEVDKVHTLNISVDTSATISQIQNFVASYNDFIDISNDLTKFNQIDTTQNGDLFGNSLVRNLQNSLSNGLLTTLSQPKYDSLASIGVTTDPTTGKLEINNEKLETAVSTQLNRVVNLFVEEDKGIATVLYNVANSYDSEDGMIKFQTESLNNDLITLLDEKNALVSKLGRMEIDLTLRFSALDKLVGDLTAKADSITRNIKEQEVKPLSFKK